MCVKKGVDTYIPVIYIYKYNVYKPTLAKYE